MGTYDYTYLAQAYGSGDYGNCSYNTSTSCTSSSSSGGTAGGTGGTSGGGSALTNTGLMIAVFVTIACVILFAAVVVRWWRRPRPATATNAKTTAIDSKD